MSDQPLTPYEAFSDLDWTPPTPRPDPDVYEQLIATVTELRSRNTPPATPDRPQRDGA